MKYAILTGVFSVFLATTALAQASALDETRTFVSYSSIDLYTNNVLADTFQISVTSSHVVLVQGTVERTLPIANITGTWENFQADGELKFEIPASGFTGSGAVGRKDGGYYLTLDFAVRKDGLKRRYDLEH